MSQCAVRGHRLRETSGLLHRSEGSFACPGRYSVTYGTLASSLEGLEMLLAACVAFREGTAIS